MDHTPSHTHEVPSSHLAAAWISDLRDRNCDIVTFRRRARQLTRLLAHRAAEELIWEPVEVTTPTGECTTGWGPAGPAPVVVPPLRAGLAMLDGVLDVYEHARVAPVGLARDERTLEPHWYLALTGHLQRAPALVCDPMLATGGTVTAVGDHLVDHGAGRIVILALIAAPAALELLASHRPTWSVHVAAVDRTLDERGFILPGLGDAGDRWCTTGSAPAPDEGQPHPR